jgi:hypothetical protein
MDLERRFQGAAETVGCFFLGILLVGPRTIAPINRPVAVEDQCGKGKIEVELKPAQVEIVRGDDPGANEFVEQRGKIGILEQDAGIKAATAEARDTPEDNEERLARSARFGESSLIIVVDPAGVLLHRGAILEDGSLAVRDGLGEGGSDEGGGGEPDQEDLISHKARRVVRNDKKGQVMRSG